MAPEDRQKPATGRQKVYKSMKKVVIDINSVLPLYRRGWISGIGRTTKELVEQLASIGDLPFELMLYSQNVRGISGRKMGLGLECRHLFLPHKPKVNQLIGKTRLRELATGYDLLHIPHNFEWVRRPDRTVVTIHDAMFFARPDEVFDHEYAQRTYPTLARRCRAIITCSESSKRDIANYMDIAEDKIFVCPWGYNRDLFFPHEDDRADKPYFLCVSCSLGRKNTMAVVKAYEQLAKQKPEHKLIMVWSNAPKEVVDFCSQDHLRDNVSIVNGVSDEQLAQLYNGATALFFPSRYEGFGLPVLEAMACGTPVVTCRNSSLPEVGGDAALYVDPDDTNAMLTYMERFEQGELKKSDLSERCLSQASKFSWQRCAEQTIDVYKHCLGI